ncbi:MAG: hypothetical protein ACP5SI_01490 [Chloroflexia bacterium]
MDNPQLLLGILGALLCLFGFSLYMGSLKLVGMVLGGSFGALAGLIGAYLGHIQDRTTVLIIALGGALLGMAIGWRFLRTLNRFLILLIGAGLGYVLGRYALDSGAGGFWSEPWVPFACALAGGIAAALLYRYIIILVTVVIGSLLIFQVSRNIYIAGIAFLIGLLVQVGLFRRLGLARRTRGRD